MAVPAEAALDAPAAHRLVAGDRVLHEAGEQVPVVGEAVGERRPVVEDVLVVPAGPGFDRSLECAVLGPERENALFERRVVGLLRDLGRVGCALGHRRSMGQA